jgi:hypothetical protein
MSGWMISGLDRLPARVRRVVLVVAGLLLVGAAIAALILAPAPGGRVRRLGPRPRTPAQKAAARPSPPPVLPPVPAVQLRRAHDAAKQFLGSYLPFAYGRVRAPAVTPVTPALGHQLVRERAQITPAERERHPRVVSLRVVQIMPGFVAAAAAVADGGIAMYPLRFTLQDSAGRWSVGSVLAG